MTSLLMVLLSSVLVTTVVLAHMPQWRPFVTPTDVFGGARVIAIVCLVAVPAVALLGWLLARFVLAPLAPGISAHAGARRRSADRRATRWT